MLACVAIAAGVAWFRAGIAPSAPAGAPRVAEWSSAALAVRERAGIFDVSVTQSTPVEPTGARHLVTP